VGRSPWAFDFLSPNPNNPTKGALFAQSYLRQALQLATDQVSLVTTSFHGLATANYTATPSGYVTGIKKFPDLTNLATAKALLSAHGWMTVDGVATCQTATLCGVPVGTTLALTMVAATGDPELMSEVSMLTSEWGALGVTLSTTYDTVAHVEGDCAVASAYDLCASGQGYSFLGQYYPSGETLFAAGAASDLGGYADPTMNALTTGVIQGTTSFATYATYAAAQSPVIYTPSPLTLTEFSNALRSSSTLVPITANSLESLTPEFWTLH
jgi:peptide/nickel transport system substrate-binding protein